MKMPHVGDKWDEELGGNMYGGPPGRLALEFAELLRADCPECPMWPDLEDPNTQEEVKAIAQEKYLFAPPFLLFGWFPRGRLGESKPNHSVWASSRLISAAAHNEQIPKMTSSPLISVAAHNEEIPKMVKLHPSICLDLLNSITEYQELLFGLIH
eukprot:gene30037-17930_t